MNLTKVINEINRKYPDIKAVLSEEFNQNDIGGIWFRGSESATINGYLIYDYWAGQSMDYGCAYEGQIYKEFRKFLKQLGLFPEPYDSGTLMAYPE